MSIHWNYQEIKESPFSNTYGVLELIEYQGKQYLRMGDCFGPDYFGPLTDEQIAAFHVLCDVKYMGYEGE